MPELLATPVPVEILGSVPPAVEVSTDGSLGSGLDPGAITFAAAENGFGAGFADTAWSDGGPASGIRTDARRSHPAPHPPAGIGVETELTGVTASAPPSTAADAAPMMVILMTKPSSCRRAIDTRKFRA
jgi:hypothetical protein